MNAAPHVLPPEVSRVLDDFVTAARDVLADDLASIVLFGSAAEGALAATSDVNVVVVLHRFQRERVDALREPLRVAQAAIRLSAMFLLRDEITVAAAAFAQKFADIGRRRRVLHGDDPFATMQVPRAALIARLDQVLLNLTLRLRAAYVERSLREEQLAPILADAASVLGTSAASLIELAGGATLAPPDALRTLGTEILGDTWTGIAANLAQARGRRRLEPGAAGTTLLQLVEVAAAMRGRLGASPARGA